MHEDPPQWMKRSVTLTSVIVFLYGLWATVICFAGGTFPLTNWHVDGGVVPGLLMFFIGEALLFWVARWVSLLVLVPIGAIAMTVKQVKQQP
ncbi:hypothetical protein OHR86_16990 [Streptomyces sp. NBC_00441]|uniref:hypothetical protein n=1 Tax=Streptomyces sp. NBC_00441 TaxID=2975742 RepID=UPI002E286147|nr:hypothetical protein [Streptomyces sp. NBC_00441]